MKIYLKKLPMLITNNPKLAQDSSDLSPPILLYPQKSYLDILTMARDYIHKNHPLHTHPLSGSIKPNETPYKSILLGPPKNALDIPSLNMIEESIATYQKFARMGLPDFSAYPQSILAQFMEVDHALISAKIKSGQRPLKPKEVLCKWN